jgi:hypothetical protein
MTAYQIEEEVIPEMRLGRHVSHDPQSLRYPFRAPGLPITNARWSRDTDVVLDQGNLGSCTGNAATGTLICSNDNHLHSNLSSTQLTGLNEDLARQIYSKATELDSWPGVWPTEDTGSDGLSVAKAAAAFGYISSYAHCFTWQDAVTALTIGPIIVGINWYSGFDNPAGDGLIAKTGSIRGGHEICFDEVDSDNKLVWFRNSWSDQWGLRGRACMTWDTFSAILAEDGDATVLAPLTAPVPPPVPTPPTQGEADQELLDISKDWVGHRKTYAPNEALRQVLIRWRSSRGQ